MPLPSSGAISLSQVAVELSRAANAQISLGETAVRNLAGLASGAISMADLRGKSSAIVVTASNAASLNLATAFGADYGAAIAKRLVVPSGVVLGPVTIPSGMGGELTIENAGEIQGLGGSANGGAGGNAITAYSSFTLKNTGAVRGGGGGGGKGGKGGNGSVSSTNREPATGSYFSTSSPRYYAEWDYWYGSAVAWNGSVFYGDWYEDSVWVRPPYTYYADFSKGWDYGDYFMVGVYRTSQQITTTYGGAGGNGGRGRGYNQSLANGSSGANGGTNAGTGGTGGNGGNWGQIGATGGSGANGNSTSGAAGSAGGAVGRAVRMLAGTLTLNNSGTINGAT